MFSYELNCRFLIVYIQGLRYIAWVIIHRWLEKYPYKRYQNQTIQLTKTTPTPKIQNNITPKMSADSPNPFLSDTKNVEGPLVLVIEHPDEVSRILKLDTCAVATCATCKTERCKLMVYKKEMTCRKCIINAQRAGSRPRDGDEGMDF